MNTPILYILCGLPFSGKSTLTQKLVTKFGLSYIALDKINSELGIGLDIEKKAITPQEWIKSYAESYKRTGDFLNEGKSVLYDAANFTKTQRDKLRSIAKTKQSKAVVIYVKITKSEARKRWMANKKSKVRSDIREEDFNLVVDNFEIPTAEENVVVYNQPRNTGRWIAKYFSL